MFARRREMHPKKRTNPIGLFLVTLEELDTHCRERLAAFKYPRQITILKSLPKGPTGKIIKSRLGK